MLIYNTSSHRFTSASLSILVHPPPYKHVYNLMHHGQVRITKPAALANNGKGDTNRRQFKYNPYPIPKAKERQIEVWRDKKRTEK